MASAESKAVLVNDAPASEPVRVYGWRRATRKEQRRLVRVYSPTSQDEGKGMRTAGGTRYKVLGLSPLAARKVSAIASAKTPDELKSAKATVSVGATIVRLTPRRSRKRTLRLLRRAEAQDLAGIRHRDVVHLMEMHRANQVVNDDPGPPVPVVPMEDPK